MAAYTTIDDPTVYFQVQLYTGTGSSQAVTLGGDPFHVSAGGTRLPWGMPEYDYMGWWQDKPIEVIKGPVTGLPIPADSEIALEGEMLPIEVGSRMEGPFSEWTGHFAEGRPESAFKIKSILLMKGFSDSLRCPLSIRVKYIAS